MNTPLSSLPFKHLPVVTVVLLVILSSCVPEDSVSQKKNQTLTPDERYLVTTYMKITKIEGDLQDNQEKLEKKLFQLKNRTDSVRVVRTLDKLKQNPQRWLAVYNRINTLIRRREAQNQR